MANYIELDDITTRLTNDITELLKERGIAVSEKGEEKIWLMLEDIRLELK